MTFLRITVRQPSAEELMATLSPEQTAFAELFESAIIKRIAERRNLNAKFVTNVRVAFSKHAFPKTGLHVAESGEVYISPEERLDMGVVVRAILRDGGIWCDHVHVEGLAYDGEEAFRVSWEWCTLQLVLKESIVPGVELQD